MGDQGWAVDPGGVEAVLNDVLTKSGDISVALGGAEGTTGGGVAASAMSAATAAESAVIGEALNGYFEEQAATIQSIGDRIQACLLGASGAVTAIQQGHEEMAASTQANAVHAASTGDFSAFQEG